MKMFRRILASFVIALIAFTAVAPASAQGSLVNKSYQLKGGLDLSGAFPLDTLQVGTTVTFACGVGALTSKWISGPLVDFVAHGTTYTLYAKQGYPDVKRLAALVGVSPKLGIFGGRVSKCYDQTGQGHHPVQATTANQPELIIINGRVSIWFGGVLTTTAALPQLYLSYSGALNNRSFTHFAAITNYSTSAAAGPSQALFSSLLGSGTIGSPVTSDMVVGDQSSFTTGGAPPAAAGNSALLDSTVTVGASLGSVGLQGTSFVSIGNATGSAMAVNGRTATGAVLDAGSNSPTLVGGDVNNLGPFGGRLQGVILTSSILTLAQAQVTQAALAKWAGININVNLANSLNVVLDGDSSDQGQGADPLNGYSTISGGGYGYLEMVKDQLRQYPISWYNVAVTGNTIAQCTTNYTSGFTPTSTFQASSTRNIIIGPNVAVKATLNGNGDSGSAAFTDFQAWLTAVKAQGWTRIATVLLPPGADTGLAAYNTLVKANAVSLGIDIIDMTAETQVFSGNPIYNAADGHPTVLGAQRFGAYINSYALQHLNFLMRRDIGGPANDNRPVGIDVAA